MRPPGGDLFRDGQVCKHARVRDQKGAKISASSFFFVFFFRDFWGGQKAKSKLAFGTMKFESAASDLPPEGPKKKRCVVFPDFWGGQNMV